jgi:hypothetical protein
VGSIWQRLMDVYAVLWVHVGERIHVGLHAIPVRRVELVQLVWLGLGAGRVQSVVGRGRLVFQYWIYAGMVPVAVKAASSETEAGAGTHYQDRSDGKAADRYEADCSDHFGEA